MRLRARLVTKGEGIVGSPFDNKVGSGPCGINITCINNERPSKQITYAHSQTIGSMQKTNSRKRAALHFQQQPKSNGGEHTTCERRF